MFWAGGDPAGTLAELTRLGVECGQLGVPGDLTLDCAGAWKRAASEAGFRIYTVFAAFEGEDYADIPTVERTVGFIRPERVERMMAVSDFAAELGVGSIATHIGFMPEDHSALREQVRRVCGHAEGHGQTFALETGQEPAEMLRAFILDVGCANLGINFDPANMILYGTGDPMEALDVLGPHILSVHAKDGDWPAAGVPGALGQERALGEGAVGMERFVNKLRAIGYRGPLAVEREARDPQQRLIDIERGVTLLRRIASIM
jgi:sugar phosphate isomerase/epimerase